MYNNDCLCVGVKCVYSSHSLTGQVLITVNLEIFNDIFFRLAILYFC